MTQLPAEGRKGPAPVWPMPPVKGAELEIWRELWSTPQAVAWEQLGAGCVRTVARYVRVMVASDEVDERRASSRALLLAEVRQMEDRLGLTPMSMLRLRWEIVADELAGVRPVGEQAPLSAKERMRAVR